LSLGVVSAGVIVAVLTIETPAVNGVTVMPTLVLAPSANVPTLQVTVGAL
jgi:hypothetical protein